jgi:glycosyltransferase involved in cell wall biosynthesis
MFLDLAVVMPVYNEEDCIVGVVKSWLSTLSVLRISFRIMILNDGSTDNTKEMMNVFENDDRVELISKQNSGHGPTILMGYRRAAQVAHWTFQCDSDDEMKPDYFTSLWKNRDPFDALFGVRTNRHQAIPRKIISGCSRLIVKLLFGAGVTDVNTPYRLLRSSVLKRIVCQIPDDTFAPNVIISGVLAKCGLRIYETPVPHENRKTGKVSIAKWRLWRASLTSLWHTILFRPSFKQLRD